MENRIWLITDLQLQIKESTNNRKNNPVRDNICWDSSLKEVGVDERPLKAGPNSVALESVETRKEPGSS
ncbi:hypothetical protein HanIR_Chr01g0034151 [Helianthus annuus]|nr:hypothetical protein HanIR_Chr01g0034151 [Helianthus annuus]